MREITRAETIAISREIMERAERERREALEAEAKIMAREVVDRNGYHYRPHPSNPLVIQVQYGPGLRWKTHSRWLTVEVAQMELAALGRLVTEDRPQAKDAGLRDAHDTADHAG